ncbi:MAG: LysM peptidoglycan-binding domain-containing protein [Actinobacteria bacterium]|nr:LysM peptidoglycan-binding domain-containing protein [Actinomycetota bacterium]
MSNQDQTPLSTEPAEDTLEHSVFRGLSPRVDTFEPCDATPGALSRGLMGALPFVMTGTLATSAVISPGLVQHSTTAAEPGASGDHAHDQRPGIGERLSGAFLPAAHTVLSTLRPDLPATYEVQDGDTVSSIADSFGIPTPAILTLNGLSWNSLLHSGQVLKLSAEPTKKAAGSPARVAGNAYLVQNGETLSTIADRLGISTEALIAANNLSDSPTIYAGQMIRIPGSTSPVVERDAEAIMPALAQAPTVIPASAESSDQVLSADTAETEAVQEASEPHDVFDAADIELAEQPALITVKVPSPKAPVAEKKVTPVASPPVERAEPSPTPVTPAESEEEDSAEEAESTSSIGQPVSGSVTPLNDERRANAQIIVNVGREMGVSDYGIVIALTTAMQESSLRNISWGDRDSVGLYQQRPSSGWGTVDQIMDPAYATRLFFGGPNNPNAGKTRGLLDISGWESMTLTVAAQRVQISAYPDAYAKWEPSAWAWLYELT